MDVLRFISVLICSIITPIYSLTIKEIVDTEPELTTLKAYISNSDITIFADASSRITFFAPNNNALAQLPRYLQESLNRPSITDKMLFTKIMKSHSVTSLTGNSIITSSQFTEAVQAVSSNDGGSIYYFKAGQTLFANGGRLRGQTRQANNGIIHIIDAVFYPVPLSISIYSFIQNQGQQATQEPRIDMFYKLLQAYENSIPSMDRTVCKGTAMTYIRQWQQMKTVFIPSNQALTRMPILQMQRLLNTPNQLCKVVESHVIPHTVLHSAVLGDMSGQRIPALAEFIVPQRYKRGVYVENNCAQGWLENQHSNITLIDGVVHVIDGILGYVYDSILEKIRQRQDLNQFYNHLMASDVVKSQLSLETGVRNVPEDQKFTLFVPDNTAMRNVDFTQNDNLDELMWKHMIRGVTSLSEMTNATVLDSMATGQRVHFIQTEDDTHVIVDHLKAGIVEADQCTNNGIFHVINHFLGSPTQSIFSEIKINSDLVSLYISIRDTGLDNLLSTPSPPITMFAPINKAFELMRQTETGLRLLDGRNKANLRKVMERHVVQKEIYVGDMQAQQMRVESQLGDYLEIQRTSGSIYVKYGSLSSERVRVIVPDIRMKNGVMHLVDEVMFSAGGLEWTSGSSSLRSPTAAVLSLLAVMFLFIR